jgi:hypothetical protein
MSTNNTQLISATNYNTSNMIFSESQNGSVPGNGPAISFARINISTKNPDGSIGELIIPTGRLFSFGVSENTNPDTGKVNGWTMPLCLHNRDGPTESEKAWVNTFNNIVEKCIDHIINNKEELNKFDLERSDLKKFNPLYWKKEKKTVNGKQVLVVAEGTGPTLYSKLIYSKKNESFVSKFYTVNDEPIDPLELLGKYAYTTAAVKIESIFIGNKISLQVKLYEAVVEPIQSGTKRLLRPPAQSIVIQASRVVNNALDSDVSDDDSDGSVEVEAPVVAKPAVTKKVVRRIVKS